MYKKILLVAAVLALCASTSCHNTRSIEAVAVSADTLEDTTGNLWGYDGLTVGSTYTVTFDTCGTDDVTDDIIMEVK